MQHESVHAEHLGRCAAAVSRFAIVAAPASGVRLVSPSARMTTETSSPAMA
jgi:hypothetical protein